MSTKPMSSNEVNSENTVADVAGTYGFRWPKVVRMPNCVETPVRYYHRPKAFFVHGLRFLPRSIANVSLNWVVV